MPHEELIAEVRAVAARHNEAACTLIAVHAFASAAEALCLAIGSLAGYFAGSLARTPSRSRFDAFCRRYLPELGGVDPGVALAGRPRRRLGSCAELLHEAFRGGLFHEGERASGVHVVDDRGKWMLSIEGDGLARLNVIPFQAQFERGFEAFVRDLARDASLAARATRRAAFLARPAFVTRDA